jgi:hypothetical protein
MPSTETSMLDGLSTSVAVKAPCVGVETSNITLSGLQGYAADDRVLVVGQSDATTNGIYNASTGQWQRTLDADGNRDLRCGTRVLVRSDTVAVEYELITDDPIVVGTSSLVFQLRYGANATYDQSAGEVAVSAVIINDYEHPGVVDRYGTNAVPGTTDMSDAFQTAVDVAAQRGCPVEWGKTRVYRLNSPIDCTQKRGIIFNDLTNGRQATGECSIEIGHTGHGFDMSASTEFTFNEMTAKNVSGIVPASLFFIARNAGGSGADFHTFNKIRTASAAQFEDVFYTVGSEMNSFADCSIYNARNNGSIFNHNSTNPKLLSSSFMTIATGAQSNVVFNHTRGKYFAVGSGDACVFALERAGDFRFVQGMWFSTGVAYIRMTGDAASDHLTLRDIRGETDSSPTPQYGIHVNTTNTTGSSRHSYWTLDSVFGVLDPAAYLLYFENTAEIGDLSIRGCHASSGRLLSTYLMRDAFIQHHTSTVVGRAGGTVQTSHFKGQRAQVSLLGTDSNNSGVDTANGLTWQTGDTASQSAAACTGAITANSTWTARKVGKNVTVTLPALSATATAAASFSYATALPANMRPAASIRIPAIISDNGAVLNQAGFVQVASTGVITVFKDLVGTANFTAAAGAGLPTAQPFTFEAA